MAVRLTNRIVKSNVDLEPVRHTDWSICVVDDDACSNAFVLPGGNIFLFTGLIRSCKNEDQIANILAHEMSHVVLGHTAEKMSYSTLLDAVVLVPMAAIWALLPGDGIAIITQWFFNRVIGLILELPFSRSLEAEADRVGILMAAKACFDVREAPLYWAEELFQEAMFKEDGEETLFSELQGTHPSNRQRRNSLMSALPAALELRRACGCGDDLVGAVLLTRPNGQEHLVRRYRNCAEQAFLGHFGYKRSSIRHIMGEKKA